MTFEEYHRRASRTAKYKKETGVLYNVLKLAGEAGEISDKVGKALMSGDYQSPGDVSREDLDSEFIMLSLREDLLKEAGDVLWHLDALVHELGSNLPEVASKNLVKLGDRSLRDVILGSGDDR